MQYRGYKPPALQSEKEKILGFNKIPDARFASTSAGAAPSDLYKTLFQFAKKHVLIYEVPDELHPRFMPIQNTGKGTPVAVDFKGNIVGIYIAACDTIYRIFDKDDKIQLSVNIFTDKVRPYSEVFM